MERKWERGNVGGKEMKTQQVIVVLRQQSTLIFVCCRSQDHSHRDQEGRQTWDQPSHSSRSCSPSLPELLPGPQPLVLHHHPVHHRTYHHHRVLQRQSWSCAVHRHGAVCDDSNCSSFHHHHRNDVPRPSHRTLPVRHPSHQDLQVRSHCASRRPPLGPRSQA